ncbi:MAG: HIT domain-containing protein [Alphaproteobacteria bacterium]|nr:HIT domain-containing protein [Alphaproteobacteria bacterium]
MSDFTLHPQLAKDTVFVAKLPLCRVLLMQDSTYPWVVLVPERGNVREMHQLDESDQQQLMREITMVAERLEVLFEADKMNVAALGNMVPQLHVHIVARYQDDPAWPGPIWGVVPAQLYGPAVLDDMVEKVASVLT